MDSSREADRDREYIDISSGESGSGLSEAPEDLDLTTNDLIQVPKTTATPPQAPVLAKKHAPKKLKGYVVINKDEVSRERAKYNQPDQSFLTLTLPTGKPDPNNPGQYINVGPTTWYYQREVDWLNRASIKSLNDWRDQLFRRNLRERVRKTHHPWVERERDAVIRMARRQLRTRRLLVFNRLANEYNEKHKDVMHRAGEAIVKKHESSSADKLKSDRPAPWRKASAIERKSHEWEEWRKMMVEIRMKRQEDVVQGIHREEREDSPDDAEIADPNSEPPKYVDLKSIRRGIERPAKSFVTSAPTAKQPNTNLEASYNAAGHLVISYGQNIPYSYLGYKIQAILDGTKTASSFAINNSKIQPIFVVADLPPIDKLSDSNLEALEHDDIEWTMEEVIAARSLMELGEDKENNDWAGMLAPVSTNNANNSPDVMENDDDEHNGLYDAD